MVVIMQEGGKEGADARTDRPLVVDGIRGILVLTGGSNVLGAVGVPADFAQREH